MSLELTPTSELEAVNVLLSAIGESPVNDLDNAGNLYASQARQVLHGINREIQSRGWWFNEQESVALPLDVDGYCRPTTPILKLYPVRGGTPLVLRGTKVINPVTGADTFTESPVADFVVWFLAFEELPESARRYITIRAARIFQTNVLGSDQLHVFNQEHEREAYQVFASEHADFEYARGFNFINDSTDVSNIVGTDSSSTT